MRFYAAQSPRGFANEVAIRVFPSKKARDAWVERHADDGDVNSAYCGAHVISARTAKQLLSNAGDGLTRNYNRLVSE